ncbi:S8 family peptidase [Candidatus Binatia bacterium]|nr:S8 family peptidase [Candidatus Binatia bacterium]
MAEERLPLLRGRVSAVDTYEAPQRGGAPPKLPSLDPQALRARLVAQLDTIERQVQGRAETARDELATREIVAVHPSPGTKLTPEQLDDVREDARLIGVVQETGTVLLDVAKPHLGYLRDKVDAFGDDARSRSKTEKDGTTTVHRDKERAIAPVDAIGLAQLDDMRGPRLRAEALVADRPYWFEVACRGGYRRPLSETEESRAQIARQLYRAGAPHERLDEFIGPEQVYFFVRLTQPQLEALRAATDCIYEVELAPPPLRDLRLLEDVTTKDVKDFFLQAPDADAPAVVILDTGIATGHPLLKPAILSATTAGDLIPSPEDTHGHGTKMAGVALYRDLGAAIERGGASAMHWLQSSRLLVQPGEGTASDDNYEKWPVLTLGAVRSAEDADPRPRGRVFALAITRTMQEPPLQGLVPTLWSHAIDQIAHHEGHGRLIVVSAGNARYELWLALAEQHPQLQLSEKIHQPAQAANALTVGAFTARVELPASEDYAEAQLVARRPGGISPFTSTGLAGNEWPIKPDVVMEGGNLAISGSLPDASVPTLSALTTSHRHTLGQPLGQISMTSEATARAAHLAARIWAVEPKLQPETIRGLIVHSASWTQEMIQQFGGMNDRVLACGYGVPDERLASECAQERATVVVEDAMPNGVIEDEPKKKPPKRPTTRTTEPKLRRKLMVFRLPIPNEQLGDTDPDVELRVTLSYFTEPNKFGRTVFHGLDLKWDMQGPQESESAFLQRINALKRPTGPDGKRQKVAVTKSFPWDLGVQLRSRGTVQSDRWRGKMSELAGDKLLAVIPVLGWWDQRRHLKEQVMRFSLIVSVFGPGVYEVIEPRVEVPVVIAV